MQGTTDAAKYPMYCMLPYPWNNIVHTMAIIHAKNDFIIFNQFSTNFQHNFHLFSYLKLVENLQELKTVENCSLVQLKIGWELDLEQLESTKLGEYRIRST